MREQSRLEIAQQLNLSKATMHLGDALVPLARRKIVTANAPRQMAAAFALAEQTNEETIAALGDRSEDPTRAPTCSRSCRVSSSTRGCRSSR